MSQDEQDVTKPVVKGRLAATRRKGKKGNKLMGNWTDAKKAEVVTTYLLVGNAVATSAATGVPPDTIKHWKMQEWWKEMEGEIRRDDTYELDSKLKKIVAKTLDAVLDRVENGDLILDSRRGEVIRIPMKGRDLAQLSKTYIDVRQNIEEKPQRHAAEEAQASRLVKLAEQFVELARASQPVKREVNIVDAEIIDAVHERRETGLQNRVQEIPLALGTDQEPIKPEPSPS